MTKKLDSPLYETIQTQVEIAILQAETAYIKNLKQEAAEIFTQIGFPSIKNEEWKNTNVASLVKTQYAINATAATINDAQQAVINENIEAQINTILPDTDSKAAYRLVLENGKINHALSTLPQTDDIIIKPILEATAETGFDAYFGKIAVLKNNAFTCLNTTLFNEGLYIEIKANKALDLPIHIIKVINADDATLINPRNLVVVNKGANLTIVESYINAADDHVVLINGVTETHIGENAHFYHYDLQKTTNNIKIIQRIEADQRTHSNYSNYTFTLPGAPFVRNNLSLHLNEKDLESHLYGLYLTADNQVVDNHSEVHHKMPNGESNQLYKGILFDKSRGVFNGKIFVYEDAQKTNAFQQSNNVLFSNEATVNAKPQLEIFADDVKCSHGTTIGQLNTEAIFYLKSRGIGEVSAKKMMVNAFAFDVTAKIKIESLKTYLEELVESEMDKLTK